MGVFLLSPYFILWAAPGVAGSRSIARLLRATEPRGSRPFGLRSLPRRKQPSCTRRPSLSDCGAPCPAPVKGGQVAAGSAGLTTL